MIVVDTNVIAYLWLPGTPTADSERLLATDPEWCAPLLWRSEFRNVLLGQVRRRALALPVALDISARAEAMMSGREYAVDGASVLRVAAATSCAAYDCEFVVLAEDLGVELITSDREILKAFPRRARPLSGGAK